jgi:hypothetical protein
MHFKCFQAACIEKSCRMDILNKKKLHLKRKRKLKIHSNMITKINLLMTNKLLLRRKNSNLNTKTLKL